MRNAFRSRTAALLAVSLVPLSSVSAQSLSDRRAARNPIKTVEMEVACGRSDKENCAIVIPEVNARTVPNNVRLRPLESKGSVESVDALCDADINAAVVQADVLVSRGDKPDCTGKLAYIGSPVYPYVGFMIVSGKTGQDTFSGLVDNLPMGKVLRVAAGGSGSGGEATLRNVLATKPGWRNRVVIEADGAGTALNKLKDGVLDAFFVMDGPNSPLLLTVKEDLDTKTGQANFKFVDFRPSDKLLGMTYNGNFPLYSTVVIAPGYLSSTKTIATPAVFSVRDDWYRANEAVSKINRQAIEDAKPSIAAKAGARADWAQDFAPR